MEILRGSSSREETTLPFINKSYLKSYPTAIFKQLIMQTPPHANGMPAFVLSFKGWPGLLSNLHKERASQRSEISAQMKAEPSQSINIIKLNLKCFSHFLHHFNGYVNTKPLLKSSLRKITARERKVKSWINRMVFEVDSLHSGLSLLLDHTPQMQSWFHMQTSGPPADPWLTRLGLKWFLCWEDPLTYSFLLVYTYWVKTEHSFSCTLGKWIIQN